MSFSYESACMGAGRGITDLSVTHTHRDWETHAYAGFLFMTFTRETSFESV